MELAGTFAVVATRVRRIASERCLRQTGQGRQKQAIRDNRHF
jgi:hypothetical protein